MSVKKYDVNFETRKEKFEKDLQEFVIPHGNFSLYGVQYDYENGCFCRMPNAVAKTVSEGVEYFSKNTAGGRVRFSTDSSALQIKATYRILELMQHMPITGSGSFTLFEETENGEKYIHNFSPLPKEQTCFCDNVKLQGGKMRKYILYFPLYNDVKTLTVGLEKGAKIGKGKSYRNVAPILYYGSSITQGGCASRPDTCYQALISKWNNVDYINMGFSGNAKAEIEMVEYLAELDCSVFVCDYDNNAPTVEYLEKTHFRLYEKYREKRPDTPILFITRPNVGIDTDERYRIIYKTYRKAKRAGDENVYFLSGKSFFGNNGWNYTVDCAHPNDYGFLLMAKGIYKKLIEIDERYR